MKTKSSRFHIHDDLTAPEGSVAILRGAQSAGGQLPNFLGVLAGSPAALRAYVRFRAELRHGSLDIATMERISLGVAHHYRSDPGIEMHARTARQAGLGVDEVTRGQRFDSEDPKQRALLRILALLVAGEAVPAHMVEAARETGWTDEQLLEAMAFTALEQLTAMVNVAGDVPVDGSVEVSRTLAAA